MRLVVPQFIIGDGHCRAAGPKGQTICLAAAGHDGDHEFSSLDGCFVRVPFKPGVLPFHGFVS
jgi:hypothetical protein